MSPYPARPVDIDRAVDPGRAREDQQANPAGRTMSRDVGRPANRLASTVAHSRDGDGRGRAARAARRPATRDLVLWLMPDDTVVWQLGTPGRPDGAVEGRVYALPHGVYVSRFGANMRTGEEPFAQVFLQDYWRRAVALADTTVGV